ncbi:MAG: glycosyltransferase family 9 protein [Azospirillaceae bacterium]
MSPGPARAAGGRPGRSRPIERLADYYVGVPAVYALGALRTARPAPERVRRLALLQTAAIGDTVLMSAVVADLRRALPEAEIHLLAGASNAPAAPLIAGIDRVHRLDVKRVARSVAFIRSLGLDALIDFGPWPRLNALYAALSRADFTVGFARPDQRRHFAFDAPVAHRDDRHEIDNQRALLAPFAIAPEAGPSLAVPDAARASVAARGLEGVTVLHPWPGGSAAALKRWPDDRWIALARALAADGHRLVVTGAPADASESRALVDRFGLSDAAATAIAGTLDLTETAALLASARALVSVDTGVMHLAAAAGAPTLGLHGPTSPARWGPVGPRVATVVSPDPRAGYLSLGFDVPADPPDAMAAIETAAVRAALDELLSGGLPSADRLATAARKGALPGSAGGGMLTNAVAAGPGR